MKKAPEKLRFAAIAVDIVVFGIKDGALVVLLGEVDRPPHYKNVGAFIGGIMEVDETAESAAVRHLKQKAGLAGVYTEQLYTFSGINRDKRNRVVSVSYIALTEPDTAATHSFPNTRWCPIRNLPHLAYDHDEIANAALNRLRGKFSYTTIAQFLLPKEFTLTELQEVYEVVLNTTFDKRNFRKKLLALDIVEETGKMQEGVQNRPAALYTFKERKLTELPLVF